jgi:hypothetical protein
MSEIQLISKNNEASDNGCDKIANVDGLNLFLSNGKAWHGKGWTVDRNFTLQDIQDIFPDLLYNVEHRPCFSDVNGERVQITDVNAIIMKMNGFEKFFESRSATDSRPIVQPVETLEMLETAFSKFGAKFSSVGALYGGETFFVSAELPEGFSVCGDEHISYLNATDNFTGMQRFRVFSSFFRVVCRNAARAAYNCSTNKSATNHTGDMKTRVTDIIAEFECLVAAQPAAIALLQQSAAVHVCPELFVNKVLDSVSGQAGLGINVTLAETFDTLAAARNRFPKANADELEKAESLIVKQIAKRDVVFKDILNRYNTVTCNTARGSVYSAYQAVTEYANFGMKSRETERQAGNDFLSLADGKGARLTDAAWHQLALTV